MKTETHYILARPENGNSRICMTEATDKEAAASRGRADGLEAQRVHDAMQIRNLRYLG